MPTLQHGKSVIEQTPEVSGIRVLTRADLTHLTARRTPNQVQTITDGHHAVARGVAAGLSNIEVAELTGRSANRISALKQDQAFQELVAHYRGLITAEYVRSTDHLFEMATANMRKAEAMLSDKLEQAEANDEALPTRDLIAITADRMDRFGYGKTSKNLNVNVDFAANLEKARSRSARARDITPSPALAPAIEATSLRPQSTAVPPGPQVQSVRRLASFRRV